MGFIPECPEERHDPLRMVSFGPAPPAIATFAPELIDEILDHLIVALQSLPTGYQGPSSLGSYALISQAWRGPVQRRTMRRLVVKTGVQADRVKNELVASEANLLVKTLRLGSRKQPWRSWKDSPRPRDSAGSDANRANGISPRDNYLALLPLFPNVTRLHLDHPITKFRIPDIIVLQSLPIMHQLTSLTIVTRRGAPDVELVQSLLVRTPNLFHLGIISNERRYIKSRMTLAKRWIVLPHLHSLDLQGGFVAKDLASFHLLSSSTMKQIVNLRWNTRDGYIRRLIDVLAPNLRTMDYTAESEYDMPEWDFLPALQRCQSLQSLRIKLYEHIPGLFYLLPPNLESITVPSVEQAHWLLDGLTSTPAGLKTVTIDGEIAQPEHFWFTDEEKSLEEVVEACKRGGIKLLGAFQRPFLSP
ncbi:hypothetical protein RQP46_006186 [Phenoliferia psychrophenolica]